MQRELSAGGLVLRRFRGREFLAGVRLKGGSVLALPKGHPEPGESTADAATREVREETGLDARLLEKLGDVKYFYVFEGERRFKVVTFFLFRYRSGSLRDHDHEVEGAEWLALEDGPRRLSDPGEREMAEKAMSRL